MLNEPFLQFQADADGKSLVSWVAERSGLSGPTLRKPMAELRSSTLERGAKCIRGDALTRLMQAGCPPGEAEARLAAHPGSRTQGAICAGVVYEAQSPGLLYSGTIDLALRFDGVSTTLYDSRNADDISAFKRALVSLGEDYFADDSAAMPGASAALEQALTWADVEPVAKVVIKNATFSLLAHWDVEFCHQYLPGQQPRSLFALVLPRMDPACGDIEVGEIRKRRDMLWLPVRRLLDLAWCFAKEAAEGRWPDAKPSPSELEKRVDLDGDAIVNWRDGTKKLLLRDFASFWRAVAGNAGPIPWPLYVAATIWQSLLVRYDGGTVRQVLLVEEEYLRWWRFHLHDQEARGRCLGSTPWPNCLAQV